MTYSPQVRDAIRAAFEPKSVAIIGASADQTKLAGMPLRNLLGNGYKGPVYPVNPGRQEIDGVRCYPSINDVPGPVETAFIILPAAQSVEAVRECGRRGVRAAVIGSSGFAESATTEGRSAQDELRAIVRETGIHLVGPNSNGLYNAVGGVALGFNSTHAEKIPAGRLAVISHSGALFAIVAGRARRLGVGLSYFVTAGNEADLEMLDYLEYMLEDAHTDVVALVIEGLRDGTRFRNLAERARDVGKRLVALKVGESPQGQAATVAHSSRLAGDARSYAALFEQAGVPVARTAEGMVTAAALMLAAKGPVSGSAIAVTSVSGAGGALTADAAARQGVPLATFTPQTRAGLDKFRRFSPILNPVDIGALGSETAPDVFRLVAADPGVAAVVFYSYQLQRSRTARFVVAEAFARTAAESSKTFVVVAPGGVDPEEAPLFKGVHVLDDTDVCLQAVAAVLRSGAAKPAEATPATPGAPVKAPSRLRGLLAKPGALAEPESREVLEAYGIPLVPSVLAKTADDAVAAARKYARPLALKGVASGITHKSDSGLVMLKVEGEDAVRSAMAEMGRRAAAAGAELEGVLVGPMVSGDLEAIVGVTYEPALGHFLLAGLGGIHAEALDDVALWHVPARREDIDARLRKTRLGRVLTSSRWRAAGSFDGVVDAMLALQRLVLAEGERIAAVDINPLLLGGADGTVALDARVVTRGAAAGAAAH